MLHVIVFVYIHILYILPAFQRALILGTQLSFIAEVEPNSMLALVVTSIGCGALLACFVALGTAVAAQQLQRLVALQNHSAALDAALSRMLLCIATTPYQTYIPRIYDSVPPSECARMITPTWPLYIHGVGGIAKRKQFLNLSQNIRFNVPSCTGILAISFHSLQRWCSAYPRAPELCIACDL